MIDKLTEALERAGWEWSMHRFINEHGGVCWAEVWDRTWVDKAGRRRTWKGAGGVSSDALRVAMHAAGWTWSMDFSVISAP
jgi:hypothetical protein